ncbi:MAG: hypothetical protein JST33_01445 [Actinobacteria bacterium]|nr:hypothetical protein [Actinomycetota bacterium]
MTPHNPLVAGPVNTTSPLQGAFLLEDGEALVAAIKSGDWVAGGFAAFGAVMDTIATVSDPLGSLIAAGLGWLMEHLQPLKGWLNDLTGDSGAVAGFAQTWTNVGTQLRQSAQDLGTVLGDLDAADGAAVRAYLVFQRDVVAHLRGAASWADGMAAGMQMASTIVQVVHDLVRDSLAQLVGSLISYAAELVLTVGLATPLVIEQASTRVSALVGRFAKKIPDLVAAVRKLGELVEKLRVLFKRFGDTADGLLKGGKHGPDVPKHGPDGPKLGPDGAPGARPGFHADGTVNPDDFRTPRDGAYYWSGMWPRKGDEVAGEIASQGNATTLEQLLDERGIELPEWDDTNPATVATWTQVSEAYASGAAGTVHAVLGENIRPNAVWWAELERLKANPNVTQVIKVDPDTLVKTVIWPE